LYGDIPVYENTSIKLLGRFGEIKRKHPEPLQCGGEQFIEMLRFDQRIKLEELPGI
jgi:hypothetical protein